MRTSQIEYIRTKTRKQVAKVPLTEEEHQKLILPPRESLKRYRDRIQDANDWFVLTFRIRGGLLAAELHCENDVIQQLKKAHDILMKSNEAYQKDANHNWELNSFDFLIVADAVDMIDVIQREVPRETMMFAVRKSYNEMQKFVD